VKTRAVVRYHQALCCGLQFLGMPPQQKKVIRRWAKREGQLLPAKLGGADARSPRQRGGGSGSGGARNSMPAAIGRVDWRKVRQVLGVAIPLMLVATAFGWWRWQEGWKELEAQVPEKRVNVVRAQLRVPAEIMASRIVHQVEPAYPESARRAGIQGIVSLNAVIGPDGTISRLDYVEGPESLSQAAMDAVRWWRYEPYLIDGRAAPVETTINVAFQLGT
jgi:TonB family protein